MIEIENCIAAHWLDDVKDLKNEFNNYFNNQYKKDIEWYGPTFGDLITGTLFECIVNKIFSSVHKDNFKAYNDKNLTYDSVVFLDNVSEKGCNCKQRKKLKSYYFSITQYRTTSYQSLKDKINFINSAIDKTKYELCCARIEANKEYKFIIFIFEKSFFKIPENAEFIECKKGNKKSNNKNYRYDLNDNITMTISGSASDQLSIKIKNLENFLVESKSIILYNSMITSNEE